MSEHQSVSPRLLFLPLFQNSKFSTSLDNLKKLVFRFCFFPGMAKLESAWSQVAELAADDAAVSNMDDAVNLASALVKVSRLVPVEAAPGQHCGLRDRIHQRPRGPPARLEGSHQRSADPSSPWVRHSTRACRFVVGLSHLRPRSGPDA